MIVAVAISPLAHIEISAVPASRRSDAMPGIRPAGEPRRLRSGWLNGIKHLPVSYR